MNFGNLCFSGIYSTNIKYTFPNLCTQYQNTLVYSILIILIPHDEMNCLVWNIDSMPIGPDSRFHCFYGDKNYFY